MTTAIAIATPELISVHPFSHIMNGPYKLVGFSTPEDRESMNAHRKSEGLTYTDNLCGGTCEHCGTAISIVCTIEGAEGRFKVGSTCVEKVTASPEITTKVKQLVAKRTAKLNKERTARQYKEACEWLTANKSTLALQPHPKQWQGQTLADHLEWYRSNAGAAKFIATLKKDTEWKPAK